MSKTHIVVFLAQLSHCATDALAETVFRHNNVCR